MSLPVLNLSLFTNGSAEDRGTFAAQLLKSLSDHGFVKLCNHGISKEMVEDLFEWNRRFFRIPDYEKERIAHKPGPDPQRGWSRIGAENTATLFAPDKVVSKSDAKEHFDQGPPGDVQFPNRWPAESTLPGFQPYMENCYLTCEAISGQILSAMELGLGLPVGAFTNMCTHEANASEFRLMHYPPIDLAEMRKGQNRISPHFDLGVITLLFQDNVGGLEMEDRARPGEFVPVSPSAPADMVVNISETLQRWTNDVIRAGMHRVTLPPQLKEAEAATIPERYSITYFCKADRNVSLAPLPQFVSKERAPAYDNVTALEYHQRRLLAAY